MIGFKVLKRQRAVSNEVVQQFAKLPVANVSDAMSRMSAGGSRLRPMHNGAVMAGAAITVRTRPGDNLLVHKALTIAAEGDVVVVDAGGDLTNAIIGEIMVSFAQSRKIAGLVINGAIRDAGAIRQGSFPVFAAGVTHRGPYKDGPGEINTPIAIDGMVVQPGDLVIGDEDGILCVPYDLTQQVFQDTTAKHAIEEKMMADIRNGRLDTSWIDQTLSRLSCFVES